MATKRRASVCVSRNGATIQVDGVPIDEAGEVLADVLELFRLVTRGYSELIVDLPTISGSTCATNVDENDYGYDERQRRRVGFK